MNKNIIYAIVGIVIVGGIVALLMIRNGDETATPTPTATLTLSPMATATASPTTSPTSMTVSYTDAGYAPASVTVKAGESVVFKNDSTKEMWPASAMHPTHTGYPEQNTCFAGVFTGCRVAPGGSYTMKFNVAGTWAYHDHVSSTKFGTVIVTP